MSLRFIYQREANLDNENNFTVNTSVKNNVEKEKFIGGDGYLLLKLKADSIRKLKDYDKIKTLLDLINETKKKPSQTLV